MRVHLANWLLSAAEWLLRDYPSPPEPEPFRLMVAPMADRAGVLVTLRTNSDGVAEVERRHGEPTLRTLLAGDVFQLHYDATGG